MSKNEKKKLVPKLRFPEFRDSEEWERKYLDEVSKYENGKAHEQDIVDLGSIIVVNSKFISTNGEVKKYTNSPYCLSEKEDILMVLSDVPNGRAIAKCFYVNVSDLYSVNQRVCKITPGKIISKFLFLLLDKNPYFLKFDDGVKQTNLRKEDVLSCPLNIPNNKKEQQKIAGCLTSLDDLISAQTQKVEILKKHKKGLMQQLFPNEGESIPFLRFPEFRDVGEWNCVILKNLAKKIVLKNKEKNEGRVLTNSATKGILDQRDYFDKDIANKDNLYSYYIVDLGDFVYNPRTSNAAPVGPISKNNIGKGVMSPLYTVFRFNRSINDFYEQYFKSNLWNSYLYSISNTGARHDRMSITSEEFMMMPLPCPTLSEQQKIADCLTSLDELISAQTQKVEILKNHKKGLMQQLFPSIEENEE